MQLLNIKVSFKRNLGPSNTNDQLKVDNTLLSKKILWLLPMEAMS